MPTPTVYLLALPLKRSVIARLSMIASGILPITPDTVALKDVEVLPILSASPDRVSVYGTPVRSVRSTTTAERVTALETVTLEIRVRVYVPGEADEDVGDAEQTTGDISQAVANAVLAYGDPLVAEGSSLELVQFIQWPTAVTPYPEPSALAMASLIFSAGLVTT